MIVTQLPNEAFQLAAQYDMGEPIRVYCTNKSNSLKLMSGIMACMLPIFFIVETIRNHYLFDFQYLSLFGGIFIALALFLFAFILFTPGTTVYICVYGFIVKYKKTFQAIHWEEIEAILSKQAIYLTNKKYIVLNGYIEHSETLLQEIDLKASFVCHPEKGSPEEQYKQELNRQAERKQQKEQFLKEKQKFIEHEQPEEAQQLREDYQLGDFLATYHAGFKGLLGKEIVGRTVYYILFLVCLLLFIEMIFRFHFIGSGFLASLISGLAVMVLLIFSIYTPYFLARYTRLHLYDKGFVFIGNRVFEVVHWEEIEKAVFQKTLPTSSGPFCILYLKNNDKLELNWYMHEQSKIKQLFSEHIANIVEIKA